MIAIRRILCPVDLSDYSRRALDHVIAIARWYKSTVTVLRVFSPAPVAAAGPGTIVLEPIVLTPVDRDQLLAETKALAEGHADWAGMQRTQVEQMGLQLHLANQTTGAAGS